MVMIERATSTDNGFGGTTTEWVTINEVDGVVDMLSGNEVMAADALNRSSSHILIVFGMFDIKRGDRVIANSNQYRVTYVDNPMNLNRQLEISLLWEKEVYPFGD
jgi:SPP1 family predicted phage head-tail adaptor